MFITMEQTNFIPKYVGSKAYSLKILQRCGLSVPKTVVIPFSYQNQIDLISKDLKELQRDYFKGVPLAVRSSANVEDGDKNSFAGIFDSYLNIKSFDELVDSIKKCWGSLQSERAKAYAGRLGFSQDQLSMSVIIQEYIDADYSGVAFTTHPFGKNDRQMLFEICAGSGEKLVSGHISPWRITVDRSGKVLENFFPESVPHEQLIQFVKNLSQNRGIPIDIEFCIKGDNIYFLQSRPMTSLPMDAQFGQWTTADFRDGGVSARPVTPYMWSCYDFIWRKALPNYFSDLKLTQKHSPLPEMGRMIFGRPYWNLAYVKDVMKNVPGFVEKNFDRDLSIPPTYQGDGFVNKITLLKVIRAIPVILSLKKEFGRQLKKNKEILQEFENELQKYVKQIDLSNEVNPDILRTFFYNFYNKIESNYFRTIFNASNTKLDLKDKLKKYPQGDRLFLDLISHLDHLEVTDFQYALWQLAADIKELNIPWDDARILSLEQAKRNTPNIYDKFQEILKIYGHHSSRELDLRTPRYREAPDILWETVLITLRDFTSIKSPKQRGEHNLSQYRKALTELRPIDRITLSSSIKLCRKYFWMREKMREISTRTYDVLRQLALKMDRHLVKQGCNSGDIFFLRFEQALGFFDSQITLQTVKRIISEEQDYYQAYEHFSNPPEIGLKQNNISSDNYTAKLTGISASHGLIRGRARIIKEIDINIVLQPGDILVAPFTDPGWTPLLGLVAGVITETGGLLSHAALIAREFGIPAVLNVPRATQLIPDFSIIELNANIGEIKILETAENSLSKTPSGQPEI